MKHLMVGISLVAVAAMLLGACGQSQDDETLAAIAADLDALRTEVDGLQTDIDALLVRSDQDLEAIAALADLTRTGRSDILSCVQSITLRVISEVDEMLDTSPGGPIRFTPRLNCP